MSPFVIVSCALITLSVVNCKDGFTPYIVNGTDAEIKDFPFQVSMRRAASGKHFCGASILNPMWILTAGHCIKEKRPRDITVQYGVTTITRIDANAVNVSRIVVHPEYYRPKIIHDIALIRLQEPIELGESAQPMRLPKRFQPTKASIPAVLAGWGRNATLGKSSEHLQKVVLTTISREHCRDVYGKRIHDTNICAGSEDKRGSCYGDSGGALTVKGVQVGIVSWSRKPCAIKPGVFTEISKYIDWIESTIKKDLELVGLR